MQYFQKANSKQILGHVEYAETSVCDVAVLVAATAGVTVRGTSAIAAATSILFMTISF
jgi:hypothetical protein